MERIMLGRRFGRISFRGFEVVGRYFELQYIGFCV